MPNINCKYFGICGGCSLLDIPYEEECRQKNELITKIFSDFDNVDIKDGVFLGREGMRTRTKIHISKNEKGFMARKTRNIVNIDSCPLLCSELNRRIQVLPFSKKSTPEVCNMLAFSPHIQIGGVAYNVSDNVFFQSNYSVAEKMLEYVADVASSFSPQIVYDIYAGVGFFSAKLENVITKGKIIAIEENPFARSLALQNLKRTEYNTIPFEEYTNIITTIWQANNKNQVSDFSKKLAVVDPPRTGLSKRAIKNLLTLNPEVIIFVSCNIRSNITNIQELCYNDFRVVSARLFDMYPATNHVEIVAVLTKK